MITNIHNNHHYFPILTDILYRSQETQGLVVVEINNRAPSVVLLMRRLLFARL
jgi:hypothetical protein